MGFFAYLTRKKPSRQRERLSSVCHKEKLALNLLRHIGGEFVVRKDA